MGVIGCLGNVVRCSRPCTPFRPLHRARNNATALYCSIPEVGSNVSDGRDLGWRCDVLAATLLRRRPKSCVSLTCRYQRRGTRARDSAKSCCQPPGSRFRVGDPAEAMGNRVSTTLSRRPGTRESAPPLPRRQAWPSRTDRTAHNPSPSFRYARHPQGILRTRRPGVRREVPRFPGARAEHFRKRETGCGDCPALSDIGRCTRPTQSASCAASVDCRRASCSVNPPPGSLPTTAGQTCTLLLVTRHGVDNAGQVSSGMRFAAGWGRERCCKSGGISGNFRR